MNYYNIVNIMLQTLVRNNKSAAAIFLFLLLYLIIVSLKPNFIYNTDGSLRNFGVGFRKSTVIPAWLLAIVLAILSYLTILIYSSL
jgi:hypothetical protein